MRAASTPVALATVLLAGCSIQEGALGGFDAATDAPQDASLADGRTVDAGPPVDGDSGPVDVDDAGPMPDGGVDGSCADAPELGSPCDGPDEDLCDEGTWVCTGAGLECSDDTGRTIEICNDADDDCDGVIDEDATDAPIWYPDGDGDGFGVDGPTILACDAPAGYADVRGDCDDANPAIHPGAAEVCNVVDDDCSGSIDDGDVCGCPLQEHAGHLYFFCTSAAAWTDARDYCATRGYALVTIEDGGENTWITDTALALSDNRWWIGLNDRADEGTFVWVSGSGSTWRNWASGQPNDYFGQDCGALESGTDRGKWGDSACEDANRFVCEAAP